MIKVVATSHKGRDRTGSRSLAARSVVIRDMRVGRGSSCGEETESESTCPVIREARDGTGSLGESVATAGKVAAIGQGRRALGVGPVGGI